ncbi:hypothetical protein K504DRAFT_485513 [Pleomassaria siparia CBS 279.74]|uniref:Uncharacterized protein n=1 Tax=Pleomassaria siparia CBS 279.74 TaxID=1314801 RepID=A0A6G1JSW8_9PLEO|nr:hypothetical protein K504DRAFT_485513 [Pleomassaria siparia CBS 279.74]
MKGCSKVVAACGLIIQAAAALNSVPFVTVVHNINIAVRQDANDVKIAAVVPTESGQIGINPPGPEPTIANIKGHTSFLTLEGSTTKWIGSDPNNIAVSTTTTTKKGGETAVATITKGVSAIKNENGDLNILLGPAVKAKLEAIAKQVTPCAAKRKRKMRNGKRGGSTCGLADFVQRVGADEELQGSFARPLTDQVFDEIDEGYGGDDPASDPGWEGDGGHHAVHEDEGYYSDDEEGFFEGAEGAEGDAAAETVETIVFSSEEEAAAIAAGLMGSEAEAAIAVWGGSTVTAGSLLAILWATLKDGKPLSNANKVPKESIHKITKSKTKTSSPTSTPTSTPTSSSSSCPAPTVSPPSCGKCKPTSVKVEGAQATNVVDWACSEGSTKGCLCNPKTVDRITVSDANLHQAVLDAISELDKLPKEPEEPNISCPGDISPVSSKFLVDKTANGFCEEVMKDLNSNFGSTAYDIDGNKMPLLKTVKGEGGVARRALQRRSPPEKSDYYKDYKFLLSYKHEEGNCLLPKEDLCKNAWRALVRSQCGNNHGSAGDRMFVDAVIDVGCGTFSWHVEAPPKAPPKPTLSSRVCHHAHKHYDVRSSYVDQWSSLGCRREPGKKMQAGDKDIKWHPIGFGADYHQQYKISWIDGCSVTTEQSVELPMEGDQGVSCGNLLRDNYYDCNNGGAGGSIDAGCLRYDFYVI